MRTKERKRTGFFIILFLLCFSLIFCETGRIIPVNKAESTGSFEHLEQDGKSNMTSGGIGGAALLSEDNTALFSTVREKTEIQAVFSSSGIYFSEREKYADFLILCVLETFLKCIETMVKRE